VGRIGEERHGAGSAASDGWCAAWLCHR
jgi:hypothetical protein